MKVTIEPETDVEKKTTEGAAYVGLSSVAVMGLAYEGEVLRRPYHYSYGDLLDLMREFPVMLFEMGQELTKPAP